MHELSPVDTVAFRDVMGRFPTGVTVVTAGAGDAVVAMTVSSLVSVSLDPLLVLICIERDVPMHQAIRVGSSWGVSILAADQEQVSRTFAVRGAGRAELDRLRLRTGPQTGIPLLADALATLECTTTAVHGGGDHEIVLGRVRSLAVRADSAAPLVFFRGGYRNLGV